MDEILRSFLVGVSGAGVVILGLSAWVGRVLASKISEVDRSRHARDLELYRAVIQQNNNQRRRISNETFNLYMDVWGRLQDVKTIADRLWNRASHDHLRAFIATLDNVRISINRGRLILRPEHYQRLSELLTVFESYELGKKRLIEIRTDAEMDENLSMDGEDHVRQQIRRNAQAKAEYSRILDDVAAYFRKELGIEDAQQGAALDGDYAGLHPRQ